MLMAYRKLRHYFMVHEITILSSYPLEMLLHNKDATCRIGKWATKLAPYDLVFVARTTNKSQAMVDFVVEWTLYLAEVHDPPTEATRPYTLTVHGEPHG